MRPQQLPVNDRTAMTYCTGQGD